MDSEEHSESPARTKAQGKWGSACAVCAAAKAKCIRSDDTPGAPCDRCKRLSKECTNQVHQPRKKRATKPSRTSQLEERLNGLVDLLRASGELPPIGEGGTRRQGSTFSETEQDDSSRGSPVNATNQRPTPNGILNGGPGRTIFIPHTYNCYAPPRCICRAEVGELPLQTRSDEELLFIYQNHLVPIFPFVVVPAGTRPSIMKTEQPFLFSAICMVASINELRSMRGQMYAIIEHLTAQMLLSAQKSLDLLQGLLLVLGWYHNHCIMHAQMNNLVHLAQALLADLGLNRGPEVQERTSVMVLAPEPPAPRTNEERRAVLGVWFLTSSIAVGFNKLFPMRFSAYIKQCAEELETKPEYDSDILLVHLVKIQRLTEQIYNMNSRDDEVDCVPGIPRAPISAYQSALQGELDRLQCFLPPSLKDDKLVQVHLKSAALHLYEPPLIDSALLKKLSDSLTTINPSTPSALDMIYRSKAALQGFYEHWFSIPTELYPTMPLSVTTHLIYSITMLARWAKLMGPGRTLQSPNAPEDILAAHKILFDPSGDRPSPSSRPSPSGTVSAGSGPSPGQSSITAPSEIQASHIRETADPSIPAVVSALKAKLLMQPELGLDIIGVLSMLAQRFEKVHKEITEASDGKWHNNIWDLSAKKVLITRAKLEKWAEIIAAGSKQAAENARTQRGPGAGAGAGGSGSGSGIDSSDSNFRHSLRPVHDHDMDEGMVDGGQIVLEQDGASMMSGQLAGVSEGLEGWQYNNVWTNDLFDQLDPSLWVDDTAGWGMALLGSMQGTEMGFKFEAMEG